MEDYWNDEQLGLEHPGAQGFELEDYWKRTVSSKLLHFDHFL